MNNEIYAIHLHPEGDDTAAGSATQPLRSLQGARDRIRELRRRGEAQGAVEVYLHGGMYPMPEPLLFTGEDLCTSEHPITFRAARDGDVVIAGGYQLSGFVPHCGPVVKLDLASAGFPGLRFKQLLFQGKKQQLARYPSFRPENPYGSGWLYVEGGPVDMYEPDHGYKDRFICRDPRLKLWSNPEDIELFVFPRYNYTNDIVPLKSYNPDTGEVLLAKPAIYEIYPGDRFYFRNVREELTNPGEWYLDRAADILYFYPPEPVDCASLEVTVPTAEHLIELRGEREQTDQLYTEKIDWQDTGTHIHYAERMPARIERGFITFEGITLEGCNGTAVLMSDVTECRIAGCTIRYTGAAGVTILRGWRCSVTDSDLYEIGSHGVYMSGGIRSPFASRFTACGHVAINNYIHHVGTEHKSVAGISINGVGIRAAHNLIHDGPRWGIQSRGNDHLIEYNHIRHVNVETSDTSAIYLVDRNLTMWGTKIRYNHIHDILGYHSENGVWMSPSFAFGIYLDDFTSGVEVAGNMTYRTPGGGLYIHAGQENIVENNMFLDTAKEMAKFRRWREEVEFRTLRTRGIALRRNTIRRNIFASACADAVLYRFDTSLNAEGELDLATNRWENNLAWRYGQPVMVRITHYNGIERLVTFEEWLAMGLDYGSAAADPLFEDSDPGANPFALQPESPALALGFLPLPFERMGPYPSELRKIWPIEEASGVREFPVKSTVGSQ